ncbi:MAG: hypothetical protein IJR59_08065, partial [Firmicutes bacterium]|nr:hypothetical protein [Bacillota bacterium]
MLKRFIGIVIAAVMVLSAAAVQAEETKYDYIALGDSIAAGYGLAYPERQAYPALFANTNGLRLSNQAVSGKTAAELLSELESGKYDLSSAKVITISIGSNDIMKPMIAALAKEFGVDPNAADLDKAVKDRMEYLKKYESTDALKKRVKSMEDLLTYNAEFLSICNNTAKNTLPKIEAEIRKQNADAQIIFTNFYNPFKNKSLAVDLPEISNVQYDVGALIQPYIDTLNQNFKEGEDFKIADVYGAFTKSTYVNAQLDTRKDNVSFDPHPTDKGHRAIFLAVNEVFEPFAAEDFLYGDAN